MRLVFGSSLVLSLVLAASVPARQDDKSQLSEKSIQEVTDQLLAAARDPKEREKLPEEAKEVVKTILEADKRVDLDPKKIKYDSTERTVTMDVPAKEGAPLTATEKRKYQRDAEKIVSYAVYKYKGGIAKPAEKKIEFYAEAKPYSPPPSAAPRYVWYWVPGPCGSCCSGYYTLVKVRAAPANRPAGKTTETLPAPKETGGKVIEDKQQVSTIAPAQEEPRPVRKPMNVGGLTEKDAAEMFSRGYILYWLDDHAEALSCFEAATRLKADDARFWYYRALSEYRLGQTVAAAKSARRGAELAGMNKPSASEVGRVINALPASHRAWLRSAEQTPGASAR